MTMITSSSHVPGSSESRPDIKVGNTVSMRINAASALSSHRTAGKVLPAVFESMEVHGEVIGYKLKTETALVRVSMIGFSVPDHFAFPKSRSYSYLTSTGQVLQPRSMVVSTSGAGSAILSSQ